MSKESTSGNVDYDLSRFEPLISLVKNTSKQLPEIENFPLESEQPLTIQDVMDKKVVNLDKLLPLAQNGSFDRTAFMQMVKDVPYTIKPKEQHLKTRDGKVYDDKFQLIEVAFENGITLTHQYQFRDEKFHQDNYDEAQIKFQKALAGEHDNLGKVVIAGREGEELQCDFENNGKIYQIQDIKKNTARFEKQNLNILDYNDTVMYFSPRKNGTGYFVNIVDNIKTGETASYREDGLLWSYDNDKAQEHFLFKDDIKSFRMGDDVISYRQDNTLRSTWDNARGIGVMYKEDGKSVEYTWDKEKKRTYYENSEKAPKVPEKGLKKYSSGINGIKDWLSQKAKVLSMKTAQFFGRGGKD